jgi:ferric-dicitrate binding protein FerR (iron transport regulator)
MSKEKRNKIEKLSEKELVDKLFSEDTSRADIKKIRAWLVANGKKIIFGEEMRAKFKESFKYEEDSALAHRMWPLLAARLGFDTVWEKDLTTEVADAVNNNRNKHMPLRRGIAIRVAAVLVPTLVVVGAWSLLFNKAGDTTDRIAEMVTVSAPAGEKQTVILPEGSLVTLEGGSILEYDAENFLADRRAKVSGEALFDVATITDSIGERMPFTVSTDDLSVRVLGTVFRVRGPDALFDTSIALYEGSVAVESASKAAIAELKRGERFTLNTETGEHKVDMVPAAEMKENGFNPLMIFQDASLDDIITAMEVTYGITFTTAAEINLSTGHYEADFEGLTLSESLDILERASDGLTFSQRGDTITITKTNR